MRLLLSRDFRTPSTARDSPERLCVRGGRLPDVLPGRPPPLHALRRRWLARVRTQRGVKVLDFGLAKVVPVGGVMSGVSMLLGTPGEAWRSSFFIQPLRDDGHG